MRIDGVAALVTGGASGLGAATARRLCAAGARVTIADFHEENGAAMARELGERARFVATDVTDAGQVARAIERAGEGGPLRILVHCAGTGDAVRTVARDGTPHDPGRFLRVVEVNLLGTFHCLTHAAAAMARAEPLEGGERGVIVNTASIAAYDGQVGQLAYAATKGAVAAMTLPAARDLAPVGVRVVTIAPGLMDTPLLGLVPPEAKAALGASVPFPRRLGLPEEFALLACHVVENGYLNGEVIRLDGALRMAPR